MSICQAENGFSLDESVQKAADLHGILKFFQKIFFLRKNDEFLRLQGRHKKSRRQNTFGDTPIKSHSSHNSRNSRNSQQCVAPIMLGYRGQVTALRVFCEARLRRMKRHCVPW